MNRESKQTTKTKIVWAILLFVLAYLIISFQPTGDMRAGILITIVMYFFAGYEYGRNSNEVGGDEKNKQY